jgi:hypothetical protein
MYGSSSVLRLHTSSDFAARNLIEIVVSIHVTCPAHIIITIIIDFCHSTIVTGGPDNSDCIATMGWMTEESRFDSKHWKVISFFSTA